MTHAEGAVGCAADKMLALDSPAYGDERERAVFMEAATFGFAMGLYVNLAVALLAAAIGLRSGKKLSSN